MPTTTTTVPDYEAVRDRIVNNWRVAKGIEKKERIKEALDRFISELKAPSVQSSTPENHTPDSRTNARIGLAKGDSP